jgi:hypothetical protein
MDLNGDASAWRLSQTNINTASYGLQKHRLQSKFIIPFPFVPFLSSSYSSTIHSHPSYLACGWSIGATISASSSAAYLGAGIEPVGSRLIGGKWIKSPQPWDQQIAAHHHFQPTTLIASRSAPLPTTTTNGFVSREPSRIGTRSPKRRVIHASSSSTTLSPLRKTGRLWGGDNYSSAGGGRWGNGGQRRTPAQLLSSPTSSSTGQPTVAAAHSNHTITTSRQPTHRSMTRSLTRPSPSVGARQRPSSPRHPFPAPVASTLHMVSPSFPFIRPNPCWFLNQCTHPPTVSACI